MSQYGMIYDTASIKSQLAESNRDYYGRKTWEDLYGSIEYAKQKSIGQLEQDYSAAMAEAYASAYRTNQGIAASNLGEGYKAAAIEETDVALEEAYNAYRKNYLSGIAEIETAAAEQTQTVTDALTEQAGYIRDFANTPYQYLQYVFDQYGEGDLSENIFYNEELWKRYTNEVKDEQGNLTGERELKSWEEIAAYGAYDTYTDEQGNVQKEWTGLFDDSGNLTIKGADFYDQMINQLAYKGEGHSFGQWLQETNEDLYNWSTSYNPYNFTEAGSNLGSFKTMVGLTSTDEQYSFIERFGGMSRNEIDTMYSKFTTSVEALNKKVSESSGRDSKDILTSFSTLTGEIRDIAKELGIAEALENEMGMSFNELAEELYYLTDNALSNGEIWWEGIKSFLGAGASSYGAQAAALKTGAMVGAKLAGKTLLAATSAVPVAGWIVSAILSVGIGVASGISTSENIKATNRALAKQGQSAFNNLITNLVSYSHAQQRQKQSDFYKRNK